jgi:hypothetical protein
MKGWLRYLVGAASAALAVATFAALAQGAAPVPNPCVLVSADTVGSTLGLKTTAAGKVSTRPDGSVKQSVCTYQDGATMIQLALSPHQQSGGSGGGVPGMKHATPSGLGPAASDFYDTEAKFAFANVDFTKGAIDVVVYDKGAIPNAHMVALARTVYKALP